MVDKNAALRESRRERERARIYDSQSQNVQSHSEHDMRLERMFLFLFFCCFLFVSFRKWLVCIFCQCL